MFASIYTFDNDWDNDDVCGLFLLLQSVVWISLHQHLLLFSALHVPSGADQRISPNTPNHRHMENCGSSLSICGLILPLQEPHTQTPSSSCKCRQLTTRPHARLLLPDFLIYLFFSLLVCLFSSSPAFLVGCSTQLMIVCLQDPLTTIACWETYYYSISLIA